MTDTARDALARSRGFDRRGPHGPDDLPPRGLPCRCEWSSARHGDECPEHGERGVPIPGPGAGAELRVGYENFGPVPFLVKQIRVGEPVLAMRPTTVYPGRRGEATMNKRDDMDMAERVRKLEAELHVLKGILRWVVYSIGLETHVGIEVPCRCGEPVSADYTIDEHDPEAVREIITP